MNLNIGERFPDFELVGKFPFILSFYRGYW